MRILLFMAAALLFVLQCGADGGKDTLTLKKRYGERTVKLTQTKNPKFLKKRRGIVDQKLSLRTYNKYAYESSKKRKNFGIFQSVQGDSIYLKSLGKNPKMMSFAIKDLEFIQTYNGRGTPFVGGAILGGNLLLAFGGLTTINANPDIGAVLILVGAVGVVTGHLIKGKRYKMATWKVVP